MLSYYIVDFGYAVNLFFIMTILLNYKRSRLVLPFVYIVSLCIYLILDFLILTEIPGVDAQVNFIIAGYFEIFATFVMLCFFVSGNIWRNYTMLILAFVFINAISSIIISFDSELEENFAGYLVNEPIPIRAAVFFVLIIVASGLLVVGIMSKLVKKEYNGNGTFYMIFSFLYALIALIQMVYKQNTIAESFENGETSAVKLVFVVMGISTFYIFGLLYYRIEGKRLSKENEKLKEYISNNDERYQKLMEENSMMFDIKTEFIEYSKEIDNKHNQSYRQELQTIAQEISQIPLTGNIVIDALIKNSYEQAKGHGIIYEIIPGNVDFCGERIINFASIVENLLFIANDYAQKSEAKEKWLYLSFRQNGDMILIKAEFSKNKRSKLSLDGNVFSKMTANMHRLKLIKSLSETMCGTTSIVNEDEEGSISVLLNNA